jgi:hypothetical protein
MYLYSSSTNGFYKKEIHGDNVPSDVVEVSDEEHLRLYNAGMNIAPNEIGYPEIIHTDNNKEEGIIK